MELFVNGISVGVKQRNSTNFPAAGLRWAVKLNDGPNTLRAVGHRDGVEVSDDISVSYQTAAWDKPARLALREISRSNDVVTVQALVFDKDGVSCLDATNVVRFGLAGDGLLLDNLGTSIGSRADQPPACQRRSRGQRGERWFGNAIPERNQCTNCLCETDARRGRD